MADLTEKSIPYDKVLHIIGGAVTTAGLLGFFPELGFYNFLISALFWGIGKEIIIDKFIRKGTPDFWDFFASCIGIATQIIPYVVGLNS